jgi:hypothetical protein
MSSDQQLEGATVPYLKCVPCRIRLERASPEVTLFDGQCPMCGTALERAGDLTELVGFRAFDLAQGDRSFDPPSGGQDQFVGRVLDAMADRNSTQGEAQLDSQRWLDEGGSFKGVAPKHR